MKKLKSILIVFTMVLTLLIFNSDVSAKKADYVQRNSAGKIVKVIKYHDNDKIYSIITNSYYSNGKYKVRTTKKWNQSGQRTYDYKRVNNSNGKARNIRVYSNYYKGIYRKRITTVYRTNARKSYHEYIIRDSKGSRISVKKYYFNKRGQLKSNSNGNAYYKYYTYFSNNKVAKYYKYKYTSKGKKHRTYYKYYSNNKPKPAKKTPRQELGNDFMKNKGFWWLDSYYLCENFDVAYNDDGTINNSSINCTFLGEKEDYYPLPAIPKEYYTNPPVKPLQ